MSREQNIRLKRFVGDKTGEPTVHAPGRRSLMRCNDNLVGAAIFRVDEPVSCVLCLAREGEVRDD